MSLTEIWLRLMLINSLGSEKALKMIKRLKNYSVINDKILLENGLNTQECQLFNTLSPEQIDVSLNWLEDPTHHLITIADDHYPDSLKSINNPPNAIFAIGNIAILKAYQLAVVGSRHLSDYGERRCREFCEYLAGAGLVITSGLALGIDGVAHRAALNVHTKTIAVLGNGLGSIYPKRHSRLAMDLIDAGGCMISEFPLNTPPLPRNFPWRNRIISGLSIATLVVEATRRSGSLVTARYALEQGRELFAIPGLVDDPRSEGPHWLIQQGAFLVYRPQDVVEYLSSELNWLSILPKVSMNLPNIENGRLPIPKLLANVGYEVTPVDVVAKRAGLPVPEAITHLLELELAGWIAAVPGGYVRLRRACHVRRTNVLI